MTPRARVEECLNENHSEGQWSPARINIYRSLSTNTAQSAARPSFGKKNLLGRLFIAILVVAMLQFLGSVTMLVSNASDHSTDEQNLPRRTTSTDDIYKTFDGNLGTSINSLRKDKKNRELEVTQVKEAIAMPHDIAIRIDDSDWSNVKTIDLHQIHILESDQKEHIIDKPRRWIDDYSSDPSENVTEDICHNHNSPPMYEWQDTFNPSCNSVHEIDLDVTRRRQGYDTLSRLVNSGFNRDVWKAEMVDGGLFALKSLKGTRNFNKVMFDQQRIDAVISEQLTSSNYVASIYGYCGYTAIYDFSEEGTLQDNYDTLSKKERLHAAWRVSRGLADTHTLGGGKSPILHSDIHPRQYVKIRGEYYLNDFNTARLMRWDRLNNRRCPARMWNHFTDCNRSPDENLIIGERKNGVDEGVDVYSLGNTFYTLLANHRAYKFVEFEDGENCVDLIRRGVLPVLPEDVEKSTDPVDIALTHAMKMCLVFDRTKRASALEVADYLESALTKINLEDESVSEEE